MKFIVKSADERFRRAGIEFNRVGVELDTDDLTEQQLDALKAEPRLSISASDDEVEIEPNKKKVVKK